LRALAATGDLWGEDPQCYLTDDEIDANTTGPSATVDAD
jgi:hypothetical protein